MCGVVEGLASTASLMLESGNGREEARIVKRLDWSGASWVRRRIHHWLGGMGQQNESSRLLAGLRGRSADFYCWNARSAMEQPQTSQRRLRYIPPAVVRCGSPDISLRVGWALFVLMRRRGPTGGPAWGPCFSRIPPCTMLWLAHRRPNTCRAGNCLGIGSKSEIITARISYTQSHERFARYGMA